MDQVILYWTPVIQFFSIYFKGMSPNLDCCNTVVYLLKFKKKTLIDVDINREMVSFKINPNMKQRK